MVFGLDNGIDMGQEIANKCEESLLTGVTNEVKADLAAGA